MASSSWPWSWPKPDTPPVVAAGSWWGWLVKAIPGDPDRLGCAVPGCVQTYKKASVNSFRVRCHVQGLLGQGVAVCKCATREDKAEAASHADPNTKSERVSAKRRAVTEIVGTDPFALARGVTVAPAVGTSTSHARQLVPTVAEMQEHAVAQEEAVRNAGIRGLFKHFMSRADADKLMMLWAKAFASANIPISVIDNDYVRDAILQTSMASCAFTPCHRTAFTGVMKRYDERLSKEVQGVMLLARCRVLSMDGWDDRAKRALLNIMLFSELGDEFLDDEDMTARPKDAIALAQLAHKWVKRACQRYPHASGQPTMFGMCTDNPTGMRNARARLHTLLEEDDSIFQPQFLRLGVLPARALAASTSAISPSSRLSLRSTRSSSRRCATSSGRVTSSVSSSSRSRRSSRTEPGASGR